MKARTRTILRRGSLTIIALLGLLLLPMIVVAQPVELSIAFSRSFDSGSQEKPGLVLQIFFTPLDGNRKPIVEIPVRSAQIVLDQADGGAYEAEIKKPTDPMQIVMVLDFSGSMIRNIGVMRNAAKEMIDKLPKEALFTVIAFSHEIVEFARSESDRDKLKNIIDQIPSPREGDGTCLFDASIAGLKVMTELGANVGRRGMVIFSDGVDQAQGGRNDPQGNPIPCSQARLPDVITLATQRSLRVPLYTIGFINEQNRNQRIDERALRDMAGATSGSFAIGTDIPTLFREISNAIEALKIAEAIVQPRDGDRVARIEIQLETGQSLISGNETFNSPRDYSFKTPTPTPTFTPLPPVSFDVSSPNYDPAKRAFNVTLSGVVSGEQIRDFTVELLTAGNISILRFQVANPPPPTPIEIGIPEGQVGKFIIRVIANSQDGRILQQRDQQAEYVPTATPTATATNTPEPVGIIINSFKYADETLKDRLVIGFDLFKPEEINRINISIIDRGNIKRLDTDVLPAPSVEINLEGLPAEQYRLQAIAFDVNGQQLGPISVQQFEHTRQPTLTPSFTPSPTAVVATADLRSINEDAAAGVYALEVVVTNEQLIKSYRLEILDGATRLTIKTLNFNVPPHDQVRVPSNEIKSLNSGDYILILSGLDADGKKITESAIPIKWTRPTDTPTPEPTATPTEPPTATPEPNDLFYLITRALNNPNQRFIVIGIFGVLVIGLVFLLFSLLRRPAKPKTGTGFLSELTGAIDIRQLEAKVPATGKKSATSAPPPALPPTQRSAPPPASAPYDATAPVPMMGGVDDRTSAVPMGNMPTAAITVEQSRFAPVIGRTVQIMHAPFTLGRKARDLNFDTDDNVSRDHCEITYDEGVFYIVDRNSTHGTFVNERRLAPNTRNPLRDGDMIRLGTTTVLRFSQSGADADPNRTAPEMPMAPPRR